MLDETGKEAFAIQLDGKLYDKREEASRALLGMLGAAVKSEEPVQVGPYHGFVVPDLLRPLSETLLWSAGGSRMLADPVGHRCVRQHETSFPSAEWSG